MIHATKSSNDRIWLDPAVEQCYQDYLHSNPLTLRVIFTLVLVLIFGWPVMSPEATASITFSRKVIVCFPGSSMKMPVSSLVVHICSIGSSLKNHCDRGDGKHGLLKPPGALLGLQERRGRCYPNFMVRTFGTLYLEERRDAWESTQQTATTNLNS